MNRNRFPTGWDEDKVRRVPGGSAGIRHRALVDQDDVRPAEPGQVVRKAVADDSGADDDDARPLVKDTALFRAHTPPPGP